MNDTVNWGAIGSEENDRELWAARTHLSGEENDMGMGMAEGKNEWRLENDSERWIIWEPGRR